MVIRMSLNHIKTSPECSCTPSQILEYRTSVYNTQTTTDRHKLNPLLQLTTQKEKQSQANIYFFSFLVHALYTPQRKKNPETKTHLEMPYQLLLETPYNIIQ